MSSNPEDEKTGEERLKGRDVKKLAKTTQRIEVKRGNAWISLEGEDIFLEPGESITIRSTEHAGVISASGDDSMVFDVSDLREQIAEMKAAKDEEVRLTKGEVQRLGDETQHIEVKRGNAWVSVGDEDILLKPGETLTVRSSKHGGVISGTGNDSMVFRVSGLREQLEEMKAAREKEAKDEED